MEVVVVSLACLFEVLSVVYCLHYLYGEKLHMDRYMVCLLVFDIALMNILYFGRLQQTWSIIIYPVIMVYCGFRFGFKLKAIIVNNIMYMAILCMIQATIIILFSKIFNLAKTGIFDNLLINILMFCVVVILLKKLKLSKLSRVLQSSEKLVIYSFIIVGISILLFLFNYKKNSVFGIMYYLVLGISILMIIIAVIDIGKHKLRAKEMEAELRLYSLYEKSFRNLIDDICARQHEFDNHINAIYSQHFLYKTYDELVEAQKKYCTQVTSENHYNKLLTKGNPNILGFLYGKFLEIEKRGIEIIYKVNIGKVESDVPIYKIIELLGNLINNAVDAALKNGTNVISVELLEKQEQIRIKVSNQNEKVDYGKLHAFFKKGYSDKGPKRGYGLYNVKRICDIYGVNIICENHIIEGQNWLEIGLLINKPL